MNILFDRLRQDGGPMLRQGIKQDANQFMSLICGQQYLAGRRESMSPKRTDTGRPARILDVIVIANQCADDRRICCPFYAPRPETPGALLRCRSA